MAAADYKSVPDLLSEKPVPAGGNRLYARRVAIAPGAISGRLSERVPFSRDESESRFHRALRRHQGPDHDGDDRRREPAGRGRQRDASRSDRAHEIRRRRPEEETVEIRIKKAGRIRRRNRLFPTARTRPAPVRAREAGLAAPLARRQQAPSRHHLGWSGGRAASEIRARRISSPGLPPRGDARARSLPCMSRAIRSAHAGPAPGV